MKNDEKVLVPSSIEHYFSLCRDLLYNPDIRTISAVTSELISRLGHLDKKHYYDAMLLATGLNIVQKKYQHNTALVYELHFNFQQKLLVALQNEFQDINFELTFREKSFVSTLSKLCDRIEDIDSINDIYAAMFIISSEKYSEQELSDMSMDVHEFIFDYCCGNLQYLPLRRGKMPSIENFNINDFEQDEIIIPKKKLNAFVGKFTKNYASTPKEKGYQSRQTSFKLKGDAETEVQLRTAKEHSYAEYGKASHLKYKEENLFGYFIKNLDFTKINMDGFKVHPDGTIEDRIGLIYAKFNLD